MKIDNADIIEDTDYVRHRSGGDLYKIALTHASLNTNLFVRFMVDVHQRRSWFLTFLSRIRSLRKSKLGKQR